MKMELEFKCILDDIIQPYRDKFYRVDISESQGLVELETQSTKDSYTRAIVLRVNLCID